jgi:hypothetical protein
MTPSSSRDAERLSQILLRIAAGLGVLLIAVVVNALLHSGGEGLNPVAVAAIRTEQAPGARMAVEAIYSSTGGGKTVTATGGGVYNAKTGRSRVSLTVPRPDGSVVKVESVGDERTVYLRSSEISAELPPGRSWLGTQPFFGKSQTAATVGGKQTHDQLQMMRTAGDDFEHVGEETVRGTLTDRYSASIDLDHYASLLRDEGKVALAHEYEQVAKAIPTPIRSEAWIDAGGLVRRMRIVMDLPTGNGGPALRMDMRFELLDFGITPRISLPDRNDVFDATPLARAELDLTDGEAMSKRLYHPAGAALTSAELSRRANAICEGFKRRGKEFARERQSLIDAVKEASNPDQLRGAMQRAGAGVYEPALRLIEDALRRLGRLRPQSQSSGAYARFLHLSASELEITEAETKAFELGDLKATRDLNKRRRSISKTTDAIANSIGLADCASDDGKANGTQS